MTDRASVVVIGGGIVGTAIAYYLTLKGQKDVVVLEKSYLSSGSTGRCAGGIRQQWSEPSNVRLAMRSVRHFENFRKELGADIEYVQGGYLLLAFNEEEETLFRNNVEMQNEEGLEVSILSVDEIKKRFPYIVVDDVKSASFCPTDGHANPHLANFAYARAAKKNGALIYTHTRALGIEVEDGQITGVETDKGYIKTGVVVNAAGGFSHQVGLMAGIDIPTESYRHQIMVSEPLEHILDPMIISFSKNFYMRQTVSGNIMMGQGDEDEKPSFNHDPSWRFLTQMSKKMPGLFPFLKNVRVLRHWAGLYNMSPDAQPIIDRARDVSDYYCAVGFSGHGFMLAPAVGEGLADWIIHGSPGEVDLSNLGLDRFTGEVKRERNVV